MAKREQEEKELKVKEQQSESLADSKKIDLYINNNEEEAKGISIMNVFSRLKQRFHIYVWVMVIGLLAGLLAPTLMYTFRDKQESAVAILGLDYAEADKSKAPDGSNLDITYLKSSYIIQNALNNVTLSKEVSTASVQSNLVITGILTDETRQKMEIINKLEEVKNVDFSKYLAEFTKEYRAQYVISLNNGFGNGRNKVKLSSGDLSHLLSAVTNSYNDYFVETYQNIELPTNEVDAINVDFLDYLDILDKVNVSLNNLQQFCNNRNELMAGYRTKSGITFADLSGMVDDIRKANVDPLYSYIFPNNVCKDKYILLNSYQSKKENLTNQLAVVQSDLNNTYQAMQDCEKDIIEIKDTSGATEQFELKSAYYNQLVLDYSNLNDQKTALEEEIAMLDYRIDKLNGPEATAEEKAKVEQDIAEVLEKAKDIYKVVSDSSQELFYSNAYQNRYMHAVTTYESESFSDNLKTFAMGALVGLFLGAAIWVIDAFTLEFKAVKKANEQLEEEAE